MLVLAYLIKAFEVRRETTVHAEDGILHQRNWGWRERENYLTVSNVLHRYSQERISRSPVWAIYLCTLGIHCTKSDVCRSDTTVITSLTSTEAVSQI